jgi:hypothetical protein
MKGLLIGIAAAAVLGLPTLAAAQMKDRPGQSEYAPGKRAKKPGEAKKYAPGHRMQRYNSPRSPGASEYAPGRQRKK